MGHQHFFSQSFMIETENDQSWNLAEHPYTHVGTRSGAAESSSNIYPSDNMSIDGSQYASHCNHASVSSGYSLTCNAQIPNHQENAAGPSVPENYRNHASSSSNHNGNPFNDDDFFEVRVVNERGQCKRKSPGSSSDVSMPTDHWQETPNVNFLRPPWDYRGDALSIGDESSLRNVRSRGALDLETDFTRTHLARDYYTTSRPMDVGPSVDLVGPSANGLARDWNPMHMSSSVHDSSSLNHESNPFVVGSSNPDGSVESGGNNNDVITRDNHVPQNFQGTSLQSVRGFRSSYIQRSTPTFGASSSSLRLGHTDEGMQLAVDSYSSRNQRPSSTIGWRNSDRNERSRMSSERYRLFSEEANFNDRTPPEGLMIVDRSAFYGSRNPPDQHRDMRLDIDDMSYEELLALGERIGSVSTGLSEDLISNCLKQSIYCSSDHMQEKGYCVICLEEYEGMDDIGMLRACNHDFHGGCIKKWLSMKNLCPICKAEPIKQK